MRPSPPSQAPGEPPSSSPSGPQRSDVYEWSSRLVALSNDRSAQAGAMREAATRVVATHVVEGRRGLAICGVSPRVGTTFIAANLAVALSQLGVSTLLVDANLRGGHGLETLIRPPQAAPGLAQALQSEAIGLEDVLHAEILPNLSVVYSGGEVESPSELLVGSQFQRFIDSCLRNHDCTLVDTPPANQSSDGRRIATALGYALLVTRKGVTFADDVAVFARQIDEDGARLIGTMFNAG